MFTPDILRCLALYLPSITLLQMRSISKALQAEITDILFRLKTDQVAHNFQRRNLLQPDAVFMQTLTSKKHLSYVRQLIKRAIPDSNEVNSCPDVNLVWDLILTTRPSTTPNLNVADIAAEMIDQYLLNFPTPELSANRLEKFVLHFLSITQLHSHTLKKLQAKILDWQAALQPRQQREQHIALNMLVRIIKHPRVSADLLHEILTILLANFIDLVPDFRHGQDYLQQCITQQRNRHDLILSALVFLLRNSSLLDLASLSQIQTALLRVTEFSHSKSHTLHTYGEALVYLVQHPAFATDAVESIYLLVGKVGLNCPGNGKDVMQDYLDCEILRQLAQRYPDQIETVSLSEVKTAFFEYLIDDSHDKFRYLVDWAPGAIREVLCIIQQHITDKTFLANRIPKALITTVITSTEKFVHDAALRGVRHFVTYYDRQSHQAPQPNQPTTASYSPPLSMAVANYKLAKLLQNSSAETTLPKLIKLFKATEYLQLDIALCNDVLRLILDKLVNIDQALANIILCETLLHFGTRCVAPILFEDMFTYAHHHQKQMASVWGRRSTVFSEYFSAFINPATDPILKHRLLVKIARKIQDPFYINLGNQVQPLTEKMTPAAESRHTLCHLLIPLLTHPQLDATLLEQLQTNLVNRISTDDMPSEEIITVLLAKLAQHPNAPKRTQLPKGLTQGLRGEQLLVTECTYLWLACLAQYYPLPPDIFNKQLVGELFTYFFSHYMHEAAVQKAAASVLKVLTQNSSANITMLAEQLQVAIRLRSEQACNEKSNHAVFAWIIRQILTITIQAQGEIQASLFSGCWRIMWQSKSFSYEQEAEKFRYFERAIIKIFDQYPELFTAFPWEELFAKLLPHFFEQQSQYEEEVIFGLPILAYIIKHKNLTKQNFAQAQQQIMFIFTNSAKYLDKTKASYETLNAFISCCPFMEVLTSLEKELLELLKTNPARTIHYGILNLLLQLARKMMLSPAVVQQLFMRLDNKTTTVEGLEYSYLAFNYLTLLLFEQRLSPDALEPSCITSPDLPPLATAFGSLFNQQNLSALSVDQTLKNQSVIL